MYLCLRTRPFWTRTGGSESSAPDFSPLAQMMIYRQSNPASGVPPIVFLANNYPHLPAYEERRGVIGAVCEFLGERFAVYGNGWTGPHARPWLRQVDEAPVYAAALGAISMSITKSLGRCTSGRLFRALASGTCVLVERFEDMEGLGLRDGINCLVWSTQDELLEICQRVITEDMTQIRGAAAEMAVALHSWSARMRELMAMVYAIREDRRAR
jgi:hypothetical protein